VNPRDADALRLEAHDGVPEAPARIVDAGLGMANERAAPLDGVRPLSCFAYDGGAVVGGAVGRTWGECCELQQLWVDERYRRRGVATRLVRLFEARAAARGCCTFYLETFSFQAPALYRRLGYEAALTIAGFPDGIVKLLMVRQGPGASA
jgi:ribosomal protein S18 acetylase RimI-like enzyme